MLQIFFGDTLFENFMKLINFKCFRSCNTF